MAVVGRYLHLRVLPTFLSFFSSFCVCVPTVLFLSQSPNLLSSFFYSFIIILCFSVSKLSFLFDSVIILCLVMTTFCCHVISFSIKCTMTEEACFDGHIFRQTMYICIGAIIDQWILLHLDRESIRYKQPSSCCGSVGREVIPTPEVRSLNTVIGEFLSTIFIYLLSTVLKRQK